MVKCPYCTQLIEDDSCYCDQCGGLLYVCPKCKKIGKGKGKRCGACGSALVPANEQSIQDPRSSQPTDPGTPPPYNPNNTYNPNNSNNPNNPTNQGPRIGSVHLPDNQPHQSDNYNTRGGTHSYHDNGIYQDGGNPSYQNGNYDNQKGNYGNGGNYNQGNKINYSNEGNYSNNGNYTNDGNYNQGNNINGNNVSFGNYNKGQMNTPQSRRGNQQPPNYNDDYNEAVIYTDDDYNQGQNYGNNSLQNPSVLEYAPMGIRLPLVSGYIIGRNNGEYCRQLGQCIYISGTHARVYFDGLQWTITDLGSRNGTRVNGAHCNPTLPFKVGDIIRLGNFYDFRVL